jgi:O-acetyl-ADP-ribose deacetylase (regulator of RNase III)
VTKKGGLMRIVNGDITKLGDVEVIVNAANGIGIMGAGVAGALRRAGGDLLMESVEAVVKKNGKPFEVGDVYVSDAGLMKRNGVTKWIYHAVTMQYPRGTTSLDTIAPLVRKCVNQALLSGAKSIAFPGLGCGIGGLDKAMVGRRMAGCLEPYSGQIAITLCDMNDELLDAARESLNAETKDEPKAPKSG